MATLCATAILCGSFLTPVSAAPKNPCGGCSIEWDSNTGMYYMTVKNGNYSYQFPDNGSADSMMEYAWIMGGCYGC